MAFVVINFYDKHGAAQAFATGVDWRMVPAAMLILFALWILAGLALACSTRFDMIPTLAICSALFLVGIMSDYLFGRHAEPVWRYDLQGEIASSQWSLEVQKSLLKEMVAKYDDDRNGIVELAERERITPEDSLAYSCGHGRFVVGVSSLHANAKLAAFLARRRPRCGQEHWCSGGMSEKHSHMWSAMSGRFSMARRVI